MWLWDRGHRKLCSLLSLPPLLLEGVSYYVVSSPVESVVWGRLEALNSSHLREAPVPPKPSGNCGHDQYLNYNTTSEQVTLRGALMNVRAAMNVRTLMDVRTYCSE